MSGPLLTFVDRQFGTGDGSTTAFTLAGPNAEPLGFVLVSAVSENGTLTSAYTVANETITFTSAPAAGAVLTWSGLGAYIPNAGAPAPLTDYTLSGTTVNLAQAPASQALCTWDGVGF